MQGGIVLTRESFRVTIQNGGKKSLPLQGQFFKVVAARPKEMGLLWSGEMWKKDNGPEETECKGRWLHGLTRRDEL